MTQSSGQRTSWLTSTPAWYLLAVVATALALGLRWALDPSLGATSQYLLYYFSVMLVAVAGGVGPGLLAVALGAVAGTWFFVVTGHVGAEWTDDALRLAAFLLYGGLTIALAGRLHAAARGATRRAAELAVDVRQREQAEAALRRATEDWERTFDSVPDLIAILDTEHRIVRANRAMAERMGTTGAQAVGLHCYECVHGLSGPPGYCPHVQTLRDGQEHAAEVHEDRLGGDFLVTTTPLRDAQGQVTGAVHVARDISPRKCMEAQLRDLNASLEQQVAQRTAELDRRHTQLQALMAELTQTEQRERRQLAQMLHDGLQQMLAAAKMRLAGVRGRTPEPAREVLDQVDGLLAESIEFSRSLTLQLSPPVLNDRGLVPALHWLARQVQTKHALEVEVRAADDAEPASADVRALLFQATQELLFNAVKHAGVRQATVTLECRAGQLRLQVADRGRGFEPAKMRDAAAPPDAAGFGLLSIQQRVEWLGGAVEIHSAPEQGTQVTVAVPLSEAGVAAPQLAPGSEFKLWLVPRWTPFGWVCRTKSKLKLELRTAAITVSRRRPLPAGGSRTARPGSSCALGW